MKAGSGIDTLSKYDRLAVLFGLAGISALAWAYLLYLDPQLHAAAMGIDAGAQGIHSWDGMDLALTLAMWAVMMIAMMTPPAIPATLAFAAIRRSHREAHDPFAATTMFLGGHLVIWLGFGLVATLAQWGLHTAALLVGPKGIDPVLSGVLLVLAGVFQWTPLKHACLARCRSPMGFFLTEWRDSAWGAVRMGLKHGGYCLACCWLLMSLWLVTGTMNLSWMAAIAVLMLVEKAAAAGQWLSRAAGLLLVGWGIWWVCGALF